jgi:hypothetical protein
VEELAGGGRECGKVCQLWRQQLYSKCGRPGKRSLNNLTRGFAPTAAVPRLKSRKYSGEAAFGVSKCPENMVSIRAVTVGMWRSWLEVESRSLKTRQSVSERFNHIAGREGGV